MSSSVEWVHAGKGGPAYVAPDFTDAYGTGLDAGNIGIWLGHPFNSDGAVLEGTPDEIRAYAARLIEAADAATPARERVEQ